MKPFSLVSTVFNEAARLPQTIADLEAQSLKPLEIVITDAGSSDATWEILNEWKQKSKIQIVLLQEKGCNVARGRNLAIQAASCDLIASTDFGCRFHPDWLQSIISPFMNEKVQVVGGAFSIQTDELATRAAQADYVLQNGYPVVMDEYFSVSSRSIAYKRLIWEEIGGYEEWLTLAADDTIFWRLIKKKGFHCVLVDEPYVSWMRHRTFHAFAKEAFRYGLGDGESGINLRNTVSHVVETGMRYFFFLLVLCTPLLVLNQLWWFFLLFVPSCLGLRSYWNAFRNWQSLDRNFPMSVLLASFYLIEFSRLFYLKGYVRGYFLATDKVKEKRKMLGGRLS